MDKDTLLKILKNTPYFEDKLKQALAKLMEQDYSKLTTESLLNHMDKVNETVKPNKFTLSVEIEDIEKSELKDLLKAPFTILVDGDEVETEIVVENLMEEIDKNMGQLLEIRARKAFTCLTNSLCERIDNLPCFTEKSAGILKKMASCQWYAEKVEDMLNRMRRNYPQLHKVRVEVNTDEIPSDIRELEELPTFNVTVNGNVEAMDVPFCRIGANMR